MAYKVSKATMPVPWPGGGVELGPGSRAEQRGDAARHV